MPYLGYGQDGYGVVYGGFELADPNAPHEIQEGSTILFDPDSPNFLVKVKLRVGTAKPVPTDAMVGPLVEFMTHFWIMRETSGTSIADIVGTAPGVINNPAKITFGLAKNGSGLIGTGLSGNDDVVIPPVTLSGKFSLESLYSINGVDWIHRVITNDPINGLVTYHNGVITAYNDYVTVPLTVIGLFSLDGITPANETLEFVRTWNFALDGPQVAALATDPYTMFGVNSDLLDEIRTIVNFMKPIRSQWRFVYL